MMLEGLIFSLIGYLLGSVIFGEVVAKFKGVNLREVGSGNVGATNVSRALGKGYGLLVLVLDLLKGFIPVFFFLKVSSLENPFAFAVILAPVLGHLYPIFFNFKGGKGVATSFGVLLALSLKVALLSFLVFLLVLVLTRIVSLSSLSASLGALVLTLSQSYPTQVIFALLILCVLIFYRHKDNLKRILRGEEPTFF